MIANKYLLRVSSLPLYSPFFTSFNIRQKPKQHTPRDGMKQRETEREHVRMAEGMSSDITIVIGSIEIYNDMYNHYRIFALYNYVTLMLYINARRCWIKVLIT